MRKKALVLLVLLLATTLFFTSCSKNQSQSSHKSNSKKVANESQKPIDRTKEKRGCHNNEWVAKNLPYEYYGVFLCHKRSFYETKNRTKQGVENELLYSNNGNDFAFVVFAENVNQNYFNIGMLQRRKEGKNKGKYSCGLYCIEAPYTMTPYRDEEKERTLYMLKLRENPEKGLYTFRVGAGAMVDFESNIIIKVEK